MLHDSRYTKRTESVQRVAQRCGLEVRTVQHWLVIFTDDYPEANLRHYTFMLEGLKDAQEALQKRGIKMVVQRGFS